jgi:hypothetical protein
MATIFYSWQSDISTSINRNFIRDALEKAIEEVTESLNLEESPRLDQDTFGIPGSPEIFNTILKKIESCAIFVADMTVIAHTEQDQAIPNPNVLIEYGYALKAISSEHIICVMNEYFGSAEDSLPFDLRHRRWPIRYNLGEEASAEEKRKQKEQLKTELGNALKPIIETGILRPKENTITEVHPMWKSSSFLKDREIVATAYYPSEPDKRRQIFWFSGPQAFLRIIPTRSSLSWTPFQLEQLIRSGSLTSMGDEGNAQWLLRNNRGAVYVSCEDSGKPGTYLKALSLTQVFKNGEIWGIEGYSLREKDTISEGKEQIKYIAAGYIENLFAKILQNYLNWARLHLKLELPLKYIAGLSGIEGYSITINSSTIDGYCVDDEVINRGEITDYNVNIADILIPFFNNIYESCGCTRPDTRR